MGRIAEQYFKKAKGLLVANDGSIFEGYLVGANSIGVGELVFNTSMSGYQEIITDPSYCGQIITFTSNNIGNVGCNKDDWESDKVYARGIVVRNFTDIPVNFRSEVSLHTFLMQAGIVGLVGVDTVAITHHLREYGALGAAIGPIDKLAELTSAAAEFGDMLGKDFVTEVATRNVYKWTEGVYNYQEHQFTSPDNSANPQVLVIDCGVKKNILRLLVSAGFRVKVWSPQCQTSLSDELQDSDAIFVSNGPGDPATQTELITALKTQIGKMPIFGICLGHQLLASALGAKTYKLKFGHRGGNHPVGLNSGLVEITVQNHGFVVDAANLCATISHINLNDRTVEGIEDAVKRLFSVQYHPESSPGPRDSLHYFDKFYAMCNR